MIRDDELESLYQEERQELGASTVDLQLVADDWSDPWGEPYTLVDAFKPRPEPEQVIAGLFRIPSLNLIVGAPGDLKTMLACDMSLCVPAGMDFLPPASWLPGALPFKVKQAPAMFIDFDNGEDDLHARFEAIARARNMPMEIPFYYHTFPDGGLNAGDKKAINFLAMRMIQRGIKLLVIDNLGVIKGRADENSDEMIPVMNNLRWLCQKTRAAIVIIHHQRKSNGINSRGGDKIRGHSSIEASLNLALAVEREPYSDHIKVYQVKQRGYQVLPFEAEFTFTHKPGSDELETAMFYGTPAMDLVSNSALEQAIIDALQGQTLNKTDLVKAVKDSLPDIGINRIRARIDSLVGLHKIFSKAGSGHETLYYLV